MLILIDQWNQILHYYHSCSFNVKYLFTRSPTLRNEAKKSTISSGKSFNDFWAEFFSPNPGNGKALENEIENLDLRRTFTFASILEKNQSFIFTINFVFFKICKTTIVPRVELFESLPKHFLKLSILSSSFLLTKLARKLPLRPSVMTKLH